MKNASAVESDCYVCYELILVWFIVAIIYSEAEAV